MPGRLLAWLPLVLGLSLGAALLAGQPDPDVLRAEGLARLLAESEEGPALFSEVAGAHRVETIEVQLRAPGDPRALATVPEYRRVLVAALNVANASREEPLRLGSGGDTRLELELSSLPHGMELAAGVEHAGERVDLSARGPWRPPGRGALVPPLLAIAVALALRRTILALFAGILAGAILLRAGGDSGWLLAAPLGLWDVFAVYLRGELVDTFRIEVIGFVFALVACVGVMTLGGGVQGLVNQLLRFARTARSTLSVSFGMGLLIFFDDYSNCLIVGSTMRPLTDRLRISREKLAYVVDSTAAPVAGLSLLSTWIAFEVSTFAPQLPAAGIAENPYAIFFQSIPFRFYSFFALGFVILNVWLGRDFGPMRAAERRASETGQVVREGGVPMVSSAFTQLAASDRLPHLARNGFLPIAVVIAATLFEIFRRGGGLALVGQDPGALATLEGWTEILFAGGGAGPLFVGSSAGLAVATFLVASNPVRIGLLGAVGLAAAATGPLTRELSTLTQPLGTYLVVGGIAAASLATVPALSRGLGVSTRRPHLAGAELWHGAYSGMRGLSFAVVILFEAWMIGQVCQDVHTAEYLIALTSGAVSALWLPVLLFAVACLVSFSTGTSWGTMSILLPNVVGLAAAVGASHTIGSLGLVLVCIGAVLEGSIFGDHCSPISDTTVLASVATASDHIDHVRTQAPYALAAAAVAVVAGYLPTLALPSWPLPAALLVGFSLWVLTLRLFGRTPTE